MFTFELSSCGSAHRFTAKTREDAMSVANGMGFFTSDKQEREFISTGKCVEFARINRKYVPLKTLRDITEDVKWQNNHDNKVAMMHWSQPSHTLDIYASLMVNDDHCLHVIHALNYIKSAFK